MKKMTLLLAREFRLFAGNKVFVFAFTALPLLLALVLGFVYREGRVDNIPVVVVDRDQTPASHRLRDMLENSAIIRVVETHYESVHLQQALLDQRAAAVVAIPYRFEADLMSGRRPEIECYLNMANTITSNAAGAAVNTCAAAMNATLVKGAPPFRSNVLFQFNPSGNYLYFLWPALIFSILHQLLLLALAVSFSGEYQRGSFAPPGLLSYSRWPPLLIGIKIAPYCLMSLVTVFVYFALSCFFRLPSVSHPLILFASQGLFVIGASLLGTLYSILIPLPLKATQLLMSISSPAFTVSGFTWPSDQAPDLLRWLGQAIPLTPYLRTLRMLLLQHAEAHDVWTQLQHQCLLVGIFFTLGWIALSIRIKKTTAA